jgi:hypothetical protein
VVDLGSQNMLEQSRVPWALTSGPVEQVV